MKKEKTPRFPVKKEEKGTFSFPMTELYRQSVENSPDAIFALDRSRAVTCCNKSCLGFFGYSEEKMRGKPIDSLFAGNIDAIAEKVDHVFNGMSCGHLEVTCRHRDGTLRTAVSRLYPVYGNDDEVALCVVANIDVTSRVEREQKLSRDLLFLTNTAMEFVEFPPYQNLYQFITKKLKEISGDCTVMVVTFDDAMDTLALQAMSELSPLLTSIIKMLGIDPYSRRYPINEPTRKSLTEKKLVKYPGSIYEFAHGVFPKNVCSIIGEKMGVKHMYTMGIVKDNVILGGVGIVMRWNRELENIDIAEAFVNQASVALMRRKAEDNFRQSEKRFRHLFDHIPGVAIQGYSPDGAIHYWNRASEEIFGYTSREAEGKNFIELLVPVIHRKEMSSFFKKGITTSAAPPPQEISLLHRDGTVIPVFSSHMIVTDSTSPAEFFSLEVDLRDRIRFEEQIKLSLREKEIMLKEIHHRVKNNMQIISSLLSLQAQTSSDHRVHASLRESQNRVKSMALIHEKLYSSYDFAHIDFEVYLKSLTLHLLRTFGKRGISYEIKAHGIFLALDLAIPCGLIVNELVSNALKYAFPGDREGTVSLELSAGPDRMALMKISDNGTDFPDNFDFSATQTLGLQLVNDLVSQIGGTISLTTGREKTFIISFAL